MPKEESKIITRETKKGKLFFNEGSHRFWTEKDGEKNYLKSVTRYTGGFEKPGLTYWAVRLMRDDLFTKLQNGEVINKEHIYLAHKLHALKKAEAGNIGTQGHAWIDQWIDNKNPDIPENPNVANIVDAFLEFQRKYNIKWGQGEFITWSDLHGYAGKPDRKAEYDGKKLIVDFKSSNELQPEYAYQTALYQIAEEEQTDETFDERLVIKLAKLTEEEYYAELEAENALRKEFGDKPKEAKAYKAFEAVFFRNNEMDKKGALEAVNTMNRLEQIKDEMKIKE